MKMEVRMDKQYSKPLSVFYAGREVCASGHFFGPALRAHYLMHVVLRGKGYYEVRGKTYNLGEGDVFLIYPNEMTLYRADEEEPWEYAWVAFDGYDVKQVLKQTGFEEEGLILHVVQTERLFERITGLAEHFVLHEYKELELTGRLYQLLSLMVKEKGIHDNQEGYIRGYYQTAFEYIRRNYGYPLKITEIAKYVGIDRTYLYKIFMEIEKCPPKQFLMQFRIQAAKNMLGTMTYSITETAYSCGFRDAAAFCNHFKRLIGMTPRQYQDNIKKNVGVDEK